MCFVYNFKGRKKIQLQTCSYGQFPDHSWFCSSLFCYALDAWVKRLEVGEAVVSTVKKLVDIYKWSWMHFRFTHFFYKSFVPSCHVIMFWLCSFQLRRLLQSSVERWRANHGRVLWNWQLVAASCHCIGSCQRKRLSTSSWPDFV